MITILIIAFAVIAGAYLASFIPYNDQPITGPQGPRGPQGPSGRYDYRKQRK